MTSTQLKTLLNPPDLNLSETRALEYLDSNFSSWESLGALSQLDKEAERTKVESAELQQQLEESQLATDGFIADAIQQTQNFLESAREVSLKRHLLADEIFALREELVPATESRGKPSLLVELEQLHNRIAELEGAKTYIRVLERGLQLSERATKAVRQPATTSFSTTILEPFRDLRNFVSRAGELLDSSQPGQDVPSISVFLRDLRAQTWKDIKAVLSSRLIEASEKISWPLPINLTAVSPADTASFQQAFLDLLSLQAEGEAMQVDAQPSGDKNERGGLYSLEALVHPVALRFKFHFDSARPTSRLDKPEWYFTHILNISHEHRGFMEHFIQPLIDKTSFRNVDAQNEFTRLLFPILARKIRRSVPNLLTQPSLFAHTIYQALLFDAAVRESGFTLANTWECRGEQKPKEWPGVADVILSHKAWFDEWMEAERRFTEQQYNEIITSLDAFAFSNDDAEEQQSLSDIRPTNSARRIKALLEQVTERYQPLPHYNQRARFLITVQVPILEAYHARIASSLDAFETLSSAFVRAVPGALAGQVGAGVDTRRLTSGHEGLQRLLKAYASACAMKNTMQGWGDSIFFLELWTEINERSALRAKVEAHPSLPATSHAHKGDEVHGTLFDELVGQYSVIATRAEDMVVRHVSSEVEVELKSYFARQWEKSNADDDDESVVIPATLVSPLTTLSTHLSLLAKTLSSSTSAALYRRVASSLASHILQRSVLHFGHGRLTPSRGAAFAREARLWVEASQMAMPNRRVEAPWQRLLDGARLVAIKEGEEFEAARWALWDGTEEQCKAFAEAIGVKTLDRKEMKDALRARSDC
ncbi:hypothetical protein BDV93DRAFT_523797 [Ceratobasidium sp. AG-I]|nr:hypothetical protein BDV93DRAFT_523797 [Ceratobasidium sp. AG-I]